MNDLIEALQILLKYNSVDRYPTHCEHDTLYICSVNYDDVDEADKERLHDLGFFEDDQDGGFLSYRFGSC